MQKIYFNKTNNKEIVDVSGEKTLAQIKEEFGDGNYKVLEIDEAIEGYRIKNNKPEKYSLIDEKQQKGAEKLAKKQALKLKIKTKLNFTDEQTQVLEEAIRGL